jgi:hypothetical protein
LTFIKNCLEDYIKYDSIESEQELIIVLNETKNDIELLGFTRLHKLQFYRKRMKQNK